MKHDKNLEWGKMLKALSSTHTTTISGICNDLKAHRSWVGKFVIPHIEESKIYLPSGRGASGDKKSVNWAQIAAKMLERPDLTEANWFCTKDYLNFIGSSVKSVTRQTILVPTELFVKNKQKFKLAYEHLESQIHESGQSFTPQTAKDYFKLIQQQDNLWRTMLKKEAEEIVAAGDCIATPRSQVEAVPYEHNVMAEFNDWVAPHDLRSYGGIDEKIFRMFFKEGYYRIELNFEDKDGNIGKKIYYLKDKTYPRHQQVNQYVTFSYAVWKNNKKLFER